MEHRAVSSYGALVLALVILAAVVSAFAAAGDHRVGQKDKKFTPDAIDAKVGDTLTFVNDDLTIHNIFSETPGHEFEIKRQSPKQVNAVKVDKPGTFTVSCKYHGQMKLVVNVTP